MKWTIQGRPSRVTTDRVHIASIGTPGLTSGDISRDGGAPAERSRAPAFTHLFPAAMVAQPAPDRLRLLIHAHLIEFPLTDIELAHGTTTLVPGSPVSALVNVCGRTLVSAVQFDPTPALRPTPQTPFALATRLRPLELARLDRYRELEREFLRAYGLE